MSNQVIVKFVSSLSCGKTAVSEAVVPSHDAVARLARIYELARNAIDYRAEHLVRRAAIERILRRQIIFTKDSDKLANVLLQEIHWAAYISEADWQSANRDRLSELLKSYLDVWDEPEINQDWLLGVISAHIEDELSPNRDYSEFTSLAFNVLRSRVEIEEPNIDLLLFVAIERVYSQADEAQVAYHLYRLDRKQMGDAPMTEVLKASYSAYNLANQKKGLNILSAYVRKQMGPLILLRDLYFSNPEEFPKIIDNPEAFDTAAQKVLADQLKLVRKRMNTATFRSLLYVFLTKMILVLLLEIPLEKMLRAGGTNYISLGINVVVPIAVMWLIVANIHLPSRKNQAKLLDRARQIIFDFDTPANSWEKIFSLVRSFSVAKFAIFYFFYALLFWLVFYAIYWVLHYFGFTVISIAVFMFFLSVVTFFAYRIRQLALTYSYSPKGESGSVGWDIITLPIVAVGDLVSRGISQLNFFILIFDFILEAPFKVILTFMDSWGRFLSSKRDEIVG